MWAVRKQRCPPWPPATHLKVVHRGDGPVGGPALVPLPQGVPGLGAEQPRRLLFLEVLYQGEGPVGACQVIASWKG